MGMVKDERNDQKNEKVDEDEEVEGINTKIFRTMYMIFCYRQDDGTVVHLCVHATF